MYQPSRIKNKIILHDWHGNPIVNDNTTYTTTYELAPEVGTYDIPWKKVDGTGIWMYMKMIDGQEVKYISHHNRNPRSHVKIEMDRL